MDDNKYTIPILNMLLTAWLMLESIDQLRNTTYNAHQLKLRLNMLETELKKKLDRDLNLLWGTDDEAMYNLQDGIRALIKEFATMRPEYLAGYAELTKRYK